MDASALIRNLERPTSQVDVVMDTDAYNEIDDQFALAYMLKNPEKLNVKAIYAAPFFNENSTGPKDGMERSYDEILKILEFMNCTGIDVCKGSEHYLTDEKTPVISDAANHLVELASHYTTDNPLYIIAIGAITNIASAILINPSIIERIVIVWLGGHGYHMNDTTEFNLIQDVAAARIVFGCGVPLVQLPCCGVVSAFSISEADLRYWLEGKNELCDYLAKNTIREASKYNAGKPWTRTIWDVTAVAWLIDGRFFLERLEKSPLPGYDGFYAFNCNSHFIKYIYFIHRDLLMEDLITKLTK